MNKASSIWVVDMAEAWRREKAIDSEIGLAMHQGYAFVRAEAQIARWLDRQAWTQGLRVSQVPWPVPLYATWRTLSGNRHSELPPAEIIFHHLRREYPGMRDELLLRVALGRVAARLDPPADRGYARARTDPAGKLPAVQFKTLRRTTPAPAEGPVPTSYLLFNTSANPIGKAVMSFSDTSMGHEAWLTTLRFVPGVQDVEHSLAAHLCAAERAHGGDYTLRTPPDFPVGQTTMEAWQRLAKAGVAHAVEPFAPVDGQAAYMGRLYLAPHPASA